MPPQPAITPQAPAPRTLTCAACGAEFSCTMDDQCWCAAEPVRMPLPQDASDCLCAACLRKAANAGAPS